MASYPYGMALYHQYKELIAALRACGDEPEKLTVSAKEFAVLVPFLTESSCLDGVPVVVEFLPLLGIVPPTHPNAKCVTTPVESQWQWPDTQPVKHFERFFEFSHDLVFDTGWDVCMAMVMKDLDKQYGVGNWEISSGGIKRETLLFEKVTRVQVKGTCW